MSILSTAPSYLRKNSDLCHVSTFYHQPDRCNLFPEAMSLATTKATTTVELKSQEKLFEGRILY